MKKYNLDNKLRFLLYKLHLRKTIPANVVNSIKICENGDTLVNITQNHDLFLDAKLNNPVYLRHNVYKKILQAQKMLPDNYYLKIFSAFRSLDEQKQRWNKKYNEIKNQFPNLSPAEITIKTKAFCANPHFGFGGHQTGGAVDIGLCDKNGNDWDMGTNYSVINKKTPMYAKHLTPEQKHNRKLLRHAMMSQGFINYPNEWWHWCWGDRMWAAYSNKKNCFYGLVE